MSSRFTGYLFVLLAATLWGTLGVFYKFLTSHYMLTPLAVVFWRALYAALFTFILLFIWRRHEIAFPRKDIKWFLATGTFGIAGFYIVYIYAITAIGIGVASVLLYSAAIWVALFGFIFQRDSLNIRKGLALILAFTGIILIGRVYNLDEIRLSFLGFFAGLGSGLGYAAYILLNKRISQFGYSTWTVNAYVLGIGAIVLLFLQDPIELTKSIMNTPVTIWLIILGIVPTLGGGLAFYAGLQRLPAVNASITATFEPVVATTLGWMIFSERLVFAQIIGALLIIGSVILIQLPQD